MPGASSAEPREPEWELYDLAADPAELENVADDPAYAGVRAELAQHLATLQAELGDHPYTGPDAPRPDFRPKHPNG